MSIFFTLVVTIYLLLDGKRLYAWLIAYIPRVHRERMAVTAEEVSGVVYAYVRGQAICSALFTVFAVVVLSALRVPAVVPLAILAGMCDVIPVIGVVLATVPAVLLALTVSPAIAGIVLVCYIAYHVVESYFIVPRIYGQRLRLSRSYLAPEVVKDHSALARSDGEAHAAAVEAVLQGEQHPWEGKTRRDVAR